MARSPRCAVSRSMRLVLSIVPSGLAFEVAVGVSSPTIRIYHELVPGRPCRKRSSKPPAAALTPPPQPFVV